MVAPGGARPSRSASRRRRRSISPRPVIHAQHVALAQQRSDLKRQPLQAEFTAAHDHVRKPGMHADAGEDCVRAA